MTRSSIKFSAVNGFTSKAAALRHLRNAGHSFVGLLAAPESNPKVAKNGRDGVLAAPLHLAPFNLSGYQVCPQASDGCAAACLHTAGNPAYMAGKDKSRKDKTKAYFTNRDAFLALLVFEIAALERKADRKGMLPAIRLNATSDLPWELRTVSLDTVDGPIKLMDVFPAVQFYDYTKVTKRALAFGAGKMPRNYYITFSATESNQEAVRDVLAGGTSVARVMAASTYKRAVSDGSMACAATGRSITVIDGDKSDFRPLDILGAIVALKAKGDAIGDTSGFVLDWHGDYHIG